MVGTDELLKDITQINYVRIILIGSVLSSGVNSDVPLNH
jgi:hypothetical protein